MSTAFSDLVSEWAAAAEDRMTAVYRRSVELLADEMGTTRPNGGRVPVKTGNLANSVLASTSGMPKTSTDKSSGFDVGSVTSMLELGTPVWIGYQATYARRMNSGFVGTDSKGREYNQDGNYFVEYAIEMWPTIVELASEDIQANAGK